MKYFIAVVALAALVAAKPQAPQEPIAILRQAADVGPEQYQYSYETANGISAEEFGSLKAAQNEEGAAIAAQGQYTYTDDQGNKFQVQYVADENGFQPQGAHLPVAPPVPEAIARALEYIAAHPQPEKH
ncbi:larval cuticle protein 65Ag1-like [Phymastichus coffea]|uniref:larval cuticle protein 65Ag1-like n=1 Tax=Phymastichus coffea TaxID=108790 RepID=UPI00273B919C|nr:larval cuticle protein 65Ag1-like [Phymastichus coffea]